MPGRRIVALSLSTAAICVIGALAPADRALAGPPQGAPAAVIAARPPAPPFLEGDEVLLSAERLERLGTQRVVTGEGVVTLRHREVRLVADRVVYNETTKDLIADGNVVLDHGSDRIQGDHLELNLQTRIGFMERAQGFIQTYYFASDRIEKRGPDRYFLDNGSFTTCEGVLPDWSFSTTSASVTVDEYMHVWNPTLRVLRMPVLYFPYAVFPVKRDRATGLLIPTIAFKQTDGLTVRNAFYWAPLDNFDATIGLDYLQETGWGSNVEMRYLLAPRTQGTVATHYLRNTSSGAERWSVSTRNSHELPLGIHAEAEAFVQSDRQFIGEQGTTLEERSSERTSSSFYLNRSWSAWDFSLSGRMEESLLTEQRTALSRFPELSVNRTSTRFLDTGLFLKLSASAVRLESEKPESSFATTRLHVSPEMTWPLSLGSFARVIPTVGYALTRYSQDTEGDEKTRGLPYLRVGLEGPRPYRIWDLGESGRFEKLKHLIEPRLTYIYTPAVNQDTIPLFDSVDRIAQANKLEYNLVNTLFAKVRSAARAPAPVATSNPIPPQLDPGDAPPASDMPAGEEAAAATDADPSGSQVAGWAGTATESQDVKAAPKYTTQELLWVKLSQGYTLDESAVAADLRPFTPIEWEARTRPLSGMELWYRGNFDVYGAGVGYQSASLAWTPLPATSLRTEWRTVRGSNQDFLDLAAAFPIGKFGIDGRSRYNLDEGKFVENRVDIKYSSQCWDMTVGYVKWTEEFQYLLNISLKGIGTVVKF